MPYYEFHDHTLTSCGVQTRFCTSSVHVIIPKELTYLGTEVTSKGGPLSPKLGVVTWSTKI